MRRLLPLPILIIILLLATLLRFHQLESQSFWHDEGNSARLSERSIELIIEGTASDIHPPLYYLMLRGWRELVGSSEFALRSLSAFLGISIVAIAFSLGHQLLGSKLSYGAIAGALIVAINPALIYYSQEARMYELLALLAVLSTYLLIRLLQSSNWRSLLLVAYVLTAAAGLYTHYFFPAVLLGQNLIFLIWLIWWRPRRDIGAEDARVMAIIDQDTFSNQRRYIAGWVGVMLLIILIYLPWLPIFLRQAIGRATTRAAIPSYLMEIGRWMAFGPTATINEVLIPFLAYGLAAVLGLYFGRMIFKRSVSFTVVLLIGITLPVILMWLTGTTRPAFNKFLLVAVPPFCLATGFGLWFPWQRASTLTESVWLRILTLILTVLIIVGTGRSLQNMYYDSAYARADYRSIATRIRAESPSNSAVILNAPNQWEVFTYYHPDDSVVFPLPRGFPDPAIIDDELQTITSKYNHLYVLFWGDAERDPERLVERWLDANAFKTDEEWVGDVRFVTYAVPAEDSAEIEVPVNLQFGESIILDSYTIDSGTHAPGEIIQVTLQWQTENRLEKRYKVFLHLIDQFGQIIAQRDSEPGGGLALTTTWVPGENVIDKHGLKILPATKKGEYDLLVGLYDIADPTARLQIDVGENMVDAYKLSTIRIDGE